MGVGVAMNMAEAEGESGPHVTCRWLRLKALDTWQMIKSHLDMWR